MTSVERELLDAAHGPCLAPSPALFDDVRDRTVAAFASLFSLTPQLMDAAAFAASIAS